MTLLRAFSELAFRGRSKRCAGLLLALCCVAAPVLDADMLRAQASHGTHITVPLDQHAGARVTAQFTAERGVLVEILGLRHWTPAMLRDSLAARARLRSFRSRRLVRELTETLHFPEVAAVAIRGGDSASHVILAVIEPQDSARAQRRVFHGDTSRSVAPWGALVELARTERPVLSAALEPLLYARAVGLAPRVPPALRADSLAVRRIWRALAAHQGTADADTARALLLRAAHVYDRLAAVAILSNFEHDDRAWHALVGALLDPDARVRRLAHHVLRTFTTQAPRWVEWRPATAELHAVLNGSALFAVRDVLDMLVTTGVGPELAGPLLHEGGHAVLLFAGASVPAFRQPSYRFLRYVSGGQDFGGVPDQWQTWIQALRP